MNRNVAAALVAASLIAGVGVGFAVNAVRDDEPEPRPNPTSTATVEPTSGPTAAPAPTDDPTAEDEETAQQRANRNERTGPSWSPADLKGPDGELLDMGSFGPGGFDAVKAGTNVNTAAAAGYLELDTEREKSCEGGPFWKWSGQWSEGLDVLVGDDQIIDFIGVSKSGTETAEGIGIGNSYGALKDTYGAKLSEPVRMDYGQPGVFLEDNGQWIGFLFDASPESLNDGSRIIFMEASVNQRPGLLRDGC